MMSQSDAEMLEYFWKLLLLGLHCNPEEVGPNTSKGMPQKDDR